MIMYVEMLKNRRRQWFWRIKAMNGKVLAHSESYSSLAACRRTAGKVATEMRMGLVTWPRQ